MARRNMNRNPEWIIACVAAHAIAPHPNFSTPRVSPPELVALLAEARFAEFHRHIDRVDAATKGDMSLVGAMRDSMMVETQPDGVRKLISLAGRQSFGLSRRVAAGLFAAAGLSEMDEVPRAVRMLERLARATSSEQFALAEAAVRQQLVLRLIEANRSDLATAQAEAVIHLLSNDHNPVSRFPVSKGYRGGPTTAAREAHQTLRSHASAALASLESFGGRRWVEVVRSRPSHADERASRSVGEAGSALAKRQFEEALSWARHRRQFLTGGDPVQIPVEGALLHAELTGDLANTRSLRELLGRLRLLQALGPTEWAASETIRLLRQSDSREALDDAVQWLRADGPIEPLITAATSILARSKMLPTQCDLSVVAAAADLLEPNQLRSAISLCHRFREEPSNGRLATHRLLRWNAVEMSWRWISRLLPGSGEDDEVAARLRDELVVSGEDLGSVGGALIGAIEAVDWSQTGPETRAGLRDWALSQADGDGTGLAREILDKLDGVDRHAETLPRPAGLALAARLLTERAAGCEADDAELGSAVAACLADMSRTVDNAERGAFSFGGYNGAEIAVLLAVVFEVESLWQPVVQFLIHEAVSSEDKGRVLDRLARLSNEIDVSKVRSLGEFAERLLAHQGVDAYDGPPFPVQPDALRFLLAFNLIENGRAMKALAALAGSRRTEARVEAARTIAIASARAPYDEWTQVTALQLSHDRDAVVRAEAGSALGSFLGTPRADVVRPRLAELLAADGVLIPLLTLRGLSRAPRDERLRGQVAGLAEEHPSRLVRQAAGVVWTA